MKRNSRHPESAAAGEGSLLFPEAIAVIFSAAVLGVLCAHAVKDLLLSLFPAPASVPIP
jgi:hypothetical protein